MRLTLFLAVLVGCGARPTEVARAPVPGVAPELVACSAQPYAAGLEALLRDRAGSVCACIPRASGALVVVEAFVDPTRDLVSLSLGTTTGVQTEHAECALSAAYSVAAAWEALASGPFEEPGAGEGVWDLGVVRCEDVSTDRSPMPPNAWIDAHPRGLGRPVRFEPGCRLPAGLRADVAYTWGS